MAWCSLLSSIDLSLAWSWVFSRSSACFRWDKDPSFMTSAITFALFNFIYSRSKTPGFAYIFKVSLAMRSQKVAFCANMCHSSKRGTAQSFRSSEMRSVSLFWHLYCSLRQCMCLQDELQSLCSVLLQMSASYLLTLCMSCIRVLYRTIFTVMKHETCSLCKGCFNVLDSNLAACCGEMGLIFSLVPRNYWPFL